MQEKREGCVLRAKERDMRQKRRGYGIGNDAMDTPKPKKQKEKY